MKKVLTILSVVGLFAIGACGTPETKEVNEDATYENEAHEQEALDLMEEMNMKVDEAEDAVEGIIEETDSIIEAEIELID